MLAGFVIVFTWCIQPLVFGVEFAGLFEYPSFSMGVICRFIRGVVHLTYLVQNFIKTGQLVSVVFERQLLLTPPRDFESGVNCRALRAVFLIPALVFAASWLPVSIPDFGCTWVAGAASCQPAVLVCAKAGHEAC